MSRASHIPGAEVCTGDARVLLTRTSPPQPDYSNFHYQLAATALSAPALTFFFPLSIWPPSDDITP